MKRDGNEVFWESLMTGDVSNAIGNQEKRGQNDLNHSDVLPIKCPREQLETLGFKFGEVVDDLFIQATMPTGWKKQATNHSMHTELFDDKGRKRGGIFYKAAFYDRAAHMSLDRRYTYGTRPLHGYDTHIENDPDVGFVMDQETIIFQTEPHELPAKGNWMAFDKMRTGLNAQARAWVDEHYPDHNSTLAYWD